MRDRLAEFEFDQQNGILVATVSGEVDSSNAGELQTRAQRASAERRELPSSSICPR